MPELVALFIQSCSVSILPVRRIVRNPTTRRRITAYPAQSLFNASTTLSCSAVIVFLSLPSKAAATCGETCLDNALTASTSGVTLAAVIVDIRVAGVVGFFRQGARNLAR